jgi:hypothetical protein
MTTILAVLIFLVGAVLGAVVGFVAGFRFADWLNERQERARYLSGRQQMDRQPGTAGLSLYTTCGGTAG